MSHGANPCNFGGRRAPGATTNTALVLAPATPCAIKHVTAIAEADRARTSQDGRSDAPVALASSETVNEIFCDALVKFGFRDGLKMLRLTDRNARFLISNLDNRGAFVPLIAVVPPNLKPPRLGAGPIAICVSATGITSASRLAPIAALPGIWVLISARN